MLCFLKCVFDICKSILLMRESEKELSHTYNYYNNYLDNTKLEIE